MLNSWILSLNNEVSMYVKPDNRARKRDREAQVLSETPKHDA